MIKITTTSENLKNLFACESAAANGSDQLTKTEVINCFSQVFAGNPVSSGNNDISAGDVGRSDHISVDPGSSSADQTGSSNSHTRHHHSSAGPV